MLELPNEEINYYQLYKYNNWSQKEISKLIEFKKNNNLEDFNECLKTIYEYKLQFNQLTSFNQEDLHRIGINNLYKNNKDREVEEILKEHEELLKEKGMPINSKYDGIISKRIKKIKKLSIYYDNIKQTKELINEKNKNSIYLKNKDNEDLIALVNAGIKQIKNYELNESQLYSLLVLLDKNPNKGKIVQILSGEGKTIIINCLAIIMVLKGHKVDIVTTNKLLAKKDLEESIELYNYFGISVGHNVEEECNENKRKIYNLFNDEDCYTKDVLYGTTFDYLRDILEDEYKLNGIRRKRNFDIVIVDEIDCMLIDKFSRISSSAPFCEKYSIFLQLLWAFYKQLNLDDEEIFKDEKLYKIVCEYLKNTINKVIQSNEFPMSNMEIEFALKQVDNWVEHLLSSLQMKNDKDFIIKNNLIMPVENSIKGDIEATQKFSYELLQFLEMKNNLPLSPIALTTNSLSNLGFFKRYINKESNNIYGMSGTLGSQKERQLLGDVYNLDFDYIPPSRERVLPELASCICFEQTDYIKNIIRIVKREINGGRSILIICETINSLELIHMELKSYCNDLNIIKINGDSDNIPETIETEIVIISTIISGRNSDLKLRNEVVRNGGGLHIIITFLPNNIRIEEQNYGIAGRNGEPSTWQLVINYKETIEKYLDNPNIKESYLNYLQMLQNQYSIKNLDLNDNNVVYNFSIDYLRKLREKKEEEILNNTLNYVDEIDKEDYLFNNYCKMLDERKELRKKENVIYLESIEEKWGIFLYNLNLIDKDKNEIISEFKNFKENIFNELDDSKIVENPRFYNKYINDQLKLICQDEESKNIIQCCGEEIKDMVKDIKKKLYRGRKTKEYENYIEKCNLSIELNRNSFIPYYLRAFCKILIGKDGVEDLKSSLFNLNKEIERYQSLFLLLKTLDINLYYINSQINILNNIKLHIIEPNINDCDGSHYKKIKMTLFEKLFPFYNEKDAENNEKIKGDENDSQYNDKKDEEDGDSYEDEDKSKHILNKYLSCLKSDGLQYFYFINEKTSLPRNEFNSINMVTRIAFSIITVGIECGFFPSDIENTVNIAFSLFEEKIKDYLSKGNSTFFDKIDYDKFGSSTDSVVNLYVNLKKLFAPDNQELNKYLQNKNKNFTRYNELDIDEICSKYDPDYQYKIDKENENFFKNKFINKLKNIRLTDNELNSLNKDKEEINDSDDSSKTLDEINSKKDYLKTMLDNEDNKKAFLGSFLLEAAGINLTHGEEGDLLSAIKKDKQNLVNICDISFKNKIKDILKSEIKKQKDELDLFSKQLNIMKKDYDKKVENLNKENKIVEQEIAFHNEEFNEFSEKINDFNKRRQEEKQKIKIFENDLQNYKEKKNNIKNREINIKSNKNEEQILRERINDIKSIHQKTEQEKNEMNKKINDINETGKALSNKKELLNTQNKQLEIERLEIEDKNLEFNIKKDIYNKNKEIYNNLDNNIILNLSEDKAKIIIDKIYLEIDDLNLILEKIENEIDIILEKGIELLAKKQIEEETNEEINTTKEKFEHRILKIDNEKNSNWNNCFNKSFDENEKYTYNFNDIKRIVKYNINRDKNKLYFKYISNIYSKDIEIIKKSIENNKILLFNNYDNDNNIWDSSCIIPNEDYLIILYKNSNGHNFSEKITNLFQNNIGYNCILKINQETENTTSENSEVYAIENINIMINEISKNTNQFINNFDYYEGFFRDENNDILYKIKKIYPEIFIKSIYDNIRKRNNSTRISLGLFKYYFMNQQNEINIKFFENIFKILINYEEIDQKEKNILKHEYQEIKDIMKKESEETNSIKDNDESENSENNDKNLKSKNNKINNSNNSIKNEKIINYIEKSNHLYKKKKVLNQKKINKLENIPKDISKNKKGNNFVDDNNKEINIPKKREIKEKEEDTDKSNSSKEIEYESKNNIKRSSNKQSSYDSYEKNKEELKIKENKENEIERFNEDSKSYINDDKSGDNEEYKSGLISQMVDYKIKDQKSSKKIKSNQIENKEYESSDSSILTGTINDALNNKASKYIINNKDRKTNKKYEYESRLIQSSDDSINNEDKFQSEESNRSKPKYDQSNKNYAYKKIFKKNIIDDRIKTPDKYINNNNNYKKPSENNNKLYLKNNKSFITNISNESIENIKEIYNNNKSTNKKNYGDNKYMIYSKKRIINENNDNYDNSLKYDDNININDQLIYNNDKYIKINNQNNNNPKINTKWINNNKNIQNISNDNNRENIFKQKTINSKSYHHIFYDKNKCKTPSKYTKKITSNRKNIIKSNRFKTPTKWKREIKTIASKENILVDNRNKSNEYRYKTMINEPKQTKKLILSTENIPSKKIYIKNKECKTPITRSKYIKKKTRENTPIRYLNTNNSIYNTYLSKTPKEKSLLKTKANKTKNKTKDFQNFVNDEILHCNDAINKKMSQKKEMEKYEDTNY